MTMIAARIRRFAHAVQAETGQSVQDILRAVVEAARNGKVVFSDKNLCTLCASNRTRITVVKRFESAVIRTHRCDFCGNVFQSEERIEANNSQRLDEMPLPIAKKPKKRQIKSRGG